MPQRALDPGTDSATVSIRVPRATKADYKRRAKSSGRSLSEWVRITLDGGVTLPKAGVTQTAPPGATRGGHVHQAATKVFVSNDIEAPKCKCGAIWMNGRWV